MDFKKISSQAKQLVGRHCISLEKNRKHIVLIGGVTVNASEDQNENCSQQVSGQCISIDLSTGENVTMPDMPTARSLAAAVCVGCRVYVAGGRTPQGWTRSFEAFDVLHGRWEVLTNMPTTLSAVEGCPHDNNVIIWGLSEARAPVIFVYLTQERSWRVIPSPSFLLLVGGEEKKDDDQDQLNNKSKAGSFFSLKSKPKASMPQRAPSSDFDQSSSGLDKNAGGMRIGVAGHCMFCYEKRGAETKMSVYNFKLPNPNWAEIRMFDKMQTLYRMLRYLNIPVSHQARNSCLSKGTKVAIQGPEDFCTYDSVRGTSKAHKSCVGAKNEFCKDVALSLVAVTDDLTVLRVREGEIGRRGPVRIEDDMNTLCVLFDPSASGTPETYVNFVHRDRGEEEGCHIEQFSVAVVDLPVFRIPPYVLILLMGVLCVLLFGTVWALA